MYRHRHIHVYKLSRSCLDICVWREKGLKITAELYFPCLLHSVHRFFLWSTLLLSFSIKFSLFLLLSRAHFPVLPPSYNSILFCHQILCPTYTAPFCFSPPKTISHVAPLPGNTSWKANPACRSHQAQTHRTTSAAPHPPRLPLHTQGALRVICGVCSNQRRLMYDLWHLYILPGHFIHFMARSQ